MLFAPESFKREDYNHVLDIENANYFHYQDLIAALAIRLNTRLENFALVRGESLQYWRLFIRKRVFEKSRFYRKNHGIQNFQLYMLQAFAAGWMAARSEKSYVRNHQRIASKNSSRLN